MKTLRLSQIFFLLMILAQGQLAIAQDASVSLDQFSGTESPSQFNLPSDGLDENAAHLAGSQNADLFGATQATTPETIAPRPNLAQQNVVFGTLQLTALVTVVGFAVLAIYLYLNREDPLGFSNRSKF